MSSVEIGSLSLPNKIIYSPLAGCSDYPFRQMSALYKPGLMFCEMVKMEPLVRSCKNTLRMLDYEDSMRPIGGQICGAKLELAAESAKIIEGLGFDVVDLNCGCPVDKVTKDGSGSGMLRTLDLMGEILQKMVSSVKIPVTVKIRSGWDQENIIVKEAVRIAETAGAKAIFVHGRTRKQAYKGPANWDYIKAAKQASKSIKVVGNGDVFDGLAAQKMLETTGCDAILVSRGTMGAPWIVEEIRRFLAGFPPLEISNNQRKEALKDHFHKILAYKGEERSLIDMRRVGCWYLKNMPLAKEFRGKISRAASVEEVEALINNCDRLQVSSIV